jgi:hypothetical protein
MPTRDGEVWNREYPHSQPMLDTLPLGIVVQDFEGRITQCNPAAESILGLSLDQMSGVTSIDPRWRAIDENGDTFPGECHPAMQALRTGQSVTNVLMGIFNPKSGTPSTDIRGKNLTIGCTNACSWTLLALRACSIEGAIFLFCARSRIGL